MSVSGEEAWPTGITFNTNGTKMFIVGTGGRDVTDEDDNGDTPLPSFCDNFTSNYNN